MSVLSVICILDLGSSLFFKSELKSPFIAEISFCQISYLKLFFFSAEKKTYICTIVKKYQLIKMTQGISLNCFLSKVLTKQADHIIIFLDRKQPYQQKPTAHLGILLKTGKIKIQQTHQQHTMSLLKIKGVLVWNKVTF